jgi:hypothetical protein
MASNPALTGGRLRILSLVAFGICLLAAPASARAANSCPWLNEATASGLLGGSAVGTYTEGAGAQPAVCTFTQQTPGITRTLQLTVEIASDPPARLVTVERACGADAAPLHAIGNEAIFCAADERKGRLGERAVGRVRDQVFIITLSSSTKDDTILTRDALKTRIYTAAEQIAGNLF